MKNTINKTAFKENLIKLIREHYKHQLGEAIKRGKAYKKLVGKQSEAA